MHASSCGAASGSHPVDEFLEIGKIPAADVGHHVDVTDDVPARDDVNLGGEVPLELVESKAGKPHETSASRPGK
jgi:hypothetical protein